MITFHNATDTDGRIIHIDEVTKENRAEHYYCVGCGGEMSAVLGDKREHHFRHKEAHCSWESYLHKLGKMRLKQRFDTQKEFVVKYYVEHHCDKHGRCVLNYNEEVEDKRTGKKCVVPRRIWMHRIPDNKIDRVAQACGCKNYAHNRYFVYNILKTTVLFLVGSG